MRNELKKQFPILHSERFDLIEIEAIHTEDIFALYSNEEVTKYFDLLPLKNLAEATKEVDFYRNRFLSKEGIRWGIVFKGTDKIIGTIGYNKVIENHKGRIGYDLLPEYWGKGYMTELLERIIKYGFENYTIERIEAEVMLGNVGSEKLLEKVGFKKEGVLKQWMYWNNRYFDIIMYALLKRDYKCK